MIFFPPGVSSTRKFFLNDVLLFTCAFFQFSPVILLSCPVQQSKILPNPCVARLFSTSAPEAKPIGPFKSSKLWRSYCSRSTDLNSFPMISDMLPENINHYSTQQQKHGRTQTTQKQVMKMLEYDKQHCLKVLSLLSRLP